MVPLGYNKDGQSTLIETKNQIDWLRKEGFRFLSYIGGEPLAPLTTKEGITFLDHTIETIRYASEKGMIVNTTTNGDYANEKTIKRLKAAGLDSLTFSLHSPKEEGLRHLIDEAKIAARLGIVPVIHGLLTTNNAETLPQIAFQVAENGILFSTAIVQEKGNGFSTLPEKSQMPTAEQTRKAFGHLLKLKSYGFVSSDKDFLLNAANHIGNDWKCNPKKDNFIHIGAGGFLNICSESRTEIKATDTSLSDKAWREQKQESVKNCEGCNYQCWQTAEHPHPISDIPAVALIGLIKAGKASLVEKIGKFAVKRIMNKDKNTI